MIYDNANYAQGKEADMSKQSIGVAALVIVSLCVARAQAQSPSYRPRVGFVPDEKPAVRVAEAVLSAIYGEEQMQSERPLSAHLQGGVWTVTGSLPESPDGGVAEMKIS